jgi:hypothetical protein
MMWNPPWTLLILSPVLSLPFTISAALWLAATITLVFYSSRLWWQLLRPGDNRLWLPAAAAGFFFPLWFCLSIGQLAPLFFAATAGAVLALNNRRDVPAAGCLALLSLKPHLFLVWLAFVTWWLIRQRRYLPLFLSPLIVGALAGAAELFRPGSLHNWIIALGSSETGSGALHTVREWKTATISYPINELLAFIFHGTYNTGPVISLIAVALTLGCCLILRPRSDLVSITPPIMCLSFLTSPFGWVFDGVLLSICNLDAYSRLEQTAGPRKARRFLFLALGFQFLCLLLSRTWLIWHHQFFWFPAAILATWYLAVRSTNICRPTCRAQDSAFDL